VRKRYPVPTVEPRVKHQSIMLRLMLLAELTRTTIESIVPHAFKKMVCEDRFG